MSFLIALSGLNAAQTDISVTSNNIANVGTLGFHSSRAQFADFVAQSPYSRPELQIGGGTLTAGMGRDFAQGSISATGNVLDLSLRGPGFFQVQATDESMAYTRAGAFRMDAEGFLVNPSGDKLMTFPTAQNGELLSTNQTGPIQVPLFFGTPKATSEIDMAMNFSLSNNGGQGTQAAIPAAAFDHTNSDTYAFETTVPMLDDEGNAVDARAYFVMTKAPDAVDPTASYEVQLVVDGVPADTPATGPIALTFDEFGQQTTGNGAEDYTLNGQTYTMDFSGSTMNSDAFDVLSAAHNGKRQSDLTALEINEDGVVYAIYGGEDPVALGRVAIGNFSDVQSLATLGNASYAETRNSGPVRLGAPGQAGFGMLQSGTLEQSNVELTEELVHLIMAQRNYQASAKAMETSSTLSQTIMNMRN